MSTTTTPASTTTSPPPTVRDQVIASANSLPDLIQKASVLDPQMAAVLTGQAQTASKTPLGALLAAGVAWAASHWGLAWGVDTDNTVAGLAIVLGGYLTHWWQARSHTLVQTATTQGTTP